MKPINVPTIPLNAAIARVTRFRDQMKGQIPDTNIPRAILIPISDLMAIVEKYSSLDDDGNITNSLQGVRAYFAVKLTDQQLDDDVTALIVAVDKEGKDLIPTSDELQGGDSEIYDFTKPCPDVCDPESPLFVP
ncbi:hypothetical protein FA048_14555 [Pedobacter polaris]|uniref:Uncharacterized protein n=1 Tax=Pedobacter polaris TaxID=2571273 RepID=A0A4U1CNT0_9SPHI|nr:hypothetical protein [Pedobacter polaris]TKC08373.1 hypothetical protein FA048_14555 [Pedobacter polaris]